MVEMVIVLLISQSGYLSMWCFECW